MRKIRSKKEKSIKTKSIKSSFFDSKEKIIGVSIVAVVLILITGIFMFMESNDGKIDIYNNTDMKLEYVKAYYVYEEGQLNNGIDIKDFAAKSSFSEPLEQINLINTESNLEIRFKFENYDALLVDAGYFNDIFDGNITIDFKQSDDNIVNLKVKAKNGLLPSNQIDCNENFIVNLSEGLVEE